MLEERIDMLFNTCINCGIKIYRYSIRCRKCYYLSKKGMKFTKTHKRKLAESHWQGGERLKKHYCIDCHKNRIDYSNFLYGNKRCKSCARKIRVGKLNPTYIDGRTNKKYYCKDCNKQLSKSAYKGTKRCSHCAKIGKLSPSYIHGKGNFPYPLEFSNCLKKIIYKRDRGICQLCYKKGYIIHHIDYDKNNNKESNLILLCKTCHPKTNYNRDYWYAYFTYIMENRNDF
jgi:hypothetical protein